jgi:hypothetical protein
MGRPQVADRGDSLQILSVAANILNKQLRTPHGGAVVGVLAIGLGFVGSNPAGAMDF